MAALATGVQLRTSSFNGNAIALRAAQVSQSRSAVAFVPVRAAQTLQGVVISTECNKTAVVAVDRMVVHPVYKKRVKSTTKYIAHDEAETAKVGDIVNLTPCRPLSKRKRFAVESVANASS